MQQSTRYTDMANVVKLCLLSSEHYNAQKQESKSLLFLLLIIILPLRKYTMLAPVCGCLGYGWTILSANSFPNLAPSAFALSVFSFPELRFNNCCKWSIDVSVILFLHTTSFQVLSIICKVSFITSYTAHTWSAGVVGTKTRESEDQDLIKLRCWSTISSWQIHSKHTFTFTHPYYLR